MECFLLLSKESFQNRKYLRGPTFLLSNEQKISSPFGAKDFVPRRGIFRCNSLAIAEKNNMRKCNFRTARMGLPLVQKISGEMMKLFFTRY